MNEDIKGFISSLIVAWNSHCMEKVQPFYHFDFEVVDVGQAAPGRGVEGLKQTTAYYWQAFPDLCIIQNDLLVQENEIALFWTATGTHRGAIWNVPATGRYISICGVSHLQLQENKIVKAYVLWDVAGLLRAIKLLPELR